MLTGCQQTKQQGRGRLLSLRWWPVLIAFLLGPEVAFPRAEWLAILRRVCQGRVPGQGRVTLCMHRLMLLQRLRHVAGRRGGGGKEFPCQRAGICHLSLSSIHVIFFYVL